MYILYRKHLENQQRLEQLRQDRLARIAKEKRLNEIRKQKLARLENMVRKKHLEAGMTLEEINNGVLYR